jgi:hypothetical protein
MELTVQGNESQTIADKLVVQAIVEVKAHVNRLNDWERTFINSIAHVQCHSELSPSQWNTLTGIKVDLERRRR